MGKVYILILMLVHFQGCPLLEHGGAELSISVGYCQSEKQSPTRCLEAGSRAGFVEYLPSMYKP